MTYIADDKTFCVCLAENEGAIHEHAKLTGLPMGRVTEVRRMIRSRPMLDNGGG